MDRTDGFIGHCWCLYTMAVSVALVIIIRLFIPIRVDEETEVNGLDLAIHGERAYDMSS